MVSDYLLLETNFKYKFREWNIEDMPSESYVLTFIVRVTKATAVSKLNSKLLSFTQMGRDKCCRIRLNDYWISSVIEMSDPYDNSEARTKL